MSNEKILEIGYLTLVVLDILNKEGVIYIYGI